MQAWSTSSRYPPSRETRMSSRPISASALRTRDTCTWMLARTVAGACSPPDRVDELLGRHGVTGVDRQPRHEGTLLGASQAGDAQRPADLDAPEKTKRRAVGSSSQLVRHRDTVRHGCSGML